MASECNKSDLEGFLAFTEPDPPDRLKEVAMKVLGETESLKEESLQKLKLLITEHGLACIPRDDFLLRFLRCKKFCVEKSFEVLQNYARLRASIHESLLALTPEVVKACFDLNIMGSLPYRDAQGRYVIFVRGGLWNSHICSDEELKMVYILVHDYITQKQSSHVFGVVGICDGSNTRFSQMTYVIRHVNFLRTFLTAYLPIRYSMQHFIKESSVINYILRLLNLLKPKKTKENLLFHGTKTEELFQHFPPSILPREFGGTLGPLNNHHITGEVVDYLQKMKDEQQYFLQKN